MIKWTIKKDDRGVTELEFYTALGDSRGVKRVLRRSKIEREELTRCYNIACCLGFDSVVKLLLPFLEECEISRPYYKIDGIQVTPVRLAIRNGNVEVANLLIGHNFNSHFHKQYVLFTAAFEAILERNEDLICKCIPMIDFDFCNKNKMFSEYDLIAAAYNYSDGLFETLLKIDGIPVINALIPVLYEWDRDGLRQVLSHPYLSISMLKGAIESEFRPKFYSTEETEPCFLITDPKYGDVHMVTFAHFEYFDMFQRFLRSVGWKGILGGEADIEKLEPELTFNKQGALMFAYSQMVKSGDFRIGEKHRGSPVHRFFSIASKLPAEVILLTCQSVQRTQFCGTVDPKDISMAFENIIKYGL